MPAAPPIATQAAPVPSRRAPELLAARLVELRPAFDGRHADGDRDGRTPRRAALRVSGDLDLVTVAQLRAALRSAWDRPPSTITLDLAGVTFIDLVGLRCVLAARWRGRLSGHELEIRAPSGCVRRLAELAAVDLHVV
jgi:anti-anti-sigma factor